MKLARAVQNIADKKHDIESRLAKLRITKQQRKCGKTEISFFTIKQNSESHTILTNAKTQRQRNE